MARKVTKDPAQIVRNTDGVHVCPLCGCYTFFQTVTGNNAVACFTDAEGTFVESNDFIVSWEVDDRGPLQCRRCLAIVAPPENHE